jgi:hypothetical protein
MSAFLSGAGLVIGFLIGLRARDSHEYTMGDKM